MKKKTLIIIALILAGCIFLMGAGLIVENELSEPEMVSGTLDEFKPENGVLTVEDFYAAVEKAEAMYRSGDMYFADKNVTVNKNIVNKSWSNVTEEEYAQYRRDILSCVLNMFVSEMPETRYLNTREFFGDEWEYLNTGYWDHLTIVLANEDNGKYASAEAWFEAYISGEIEGWITETEYSLFLFQNNFVSVTDGNGNESIIYPTAEQTENIEAIRTANGLVTE